MINVDIQEYFIQERTDQRELYNFLNIFDHIYFDNMIKCMKLIWK